MGATETSVLGVNSLNFACVSSMRERRRSRHRKRSAQVLDSAKPWAAMAPVDTLLKS
jgi:hypothetical protein